MAALSVSQRPSSSFSEGAVRIGGQYTRFQMRVGSEVDDFRINLHAFLGQKKTNTTRARRIGEGIAFHIRFISMKICVFV